MNGPLDPLWRLLREQADPRHPDEGWRRELGEGYAVAAAWLRVTTGSAGTWPCGVSGAGGCARRIVEHGYDDLVAVCGDHPPRCDKVPVRREEVGLRRLDLVALAGCFVATSGLPALPVSPLGRTLVMGPAVLGSRRVAFVLTAEASMLGLLELAEELRDRHAADRVVLLSPVDGPPDAAHVRALGRVPADLLPLRDVLGVEDGRPTASLVDWVVSRRDELGGFDPLPTIARRYDLVVDALGERCGLYGTWIAFRRHRLPFRLLMGLAKRPDGLMTRDELFDEVWPGSTTAENEGWEVNLRSHKSLLGKRIKAAVPGAEALIESVEGDPFTGGYRLALPPDRVLWWTRPRE